MRASVLIVVGFLIGLAVGVPLVVYYQGAVLDYVMTVGAYLVLVAMGCAVVYLVGAGLFNRFAKKRFGLERFGAGSIAKRINDTVWHVALMEREQAQETSGKLVAEVVSFYSMLMFYRWALGALVAVVTAVAATLGTIVLIKQNEWLSAQTDAAREQNVILAQQSIALKAQEVERINGKIVALREAVGKAKYEDLWKGKDGASICFQEERFRKPEGKEIEGKATAERVEGEINVLTSMVSSALESAKTDLPHHRVSRGNLLRVLALSGLPLTVFGYGDFEGSTLASGTFKGANLDGVNLRAALIRPEVSFVEVCATRAAFAGTMAAGVDFSGSRFHVSDFSNANLEEAPFIGAKLTGASDYRQLQTGRPESSESRGVAKSKGEDEGRFERARRWVVEEAWESVFGGGGEPPPLPKEESMWGAEFRAASVRRGIFRRATLGFVSFRDADLRDADFSGAIVEGELDFSGADLSGADLRFFKGKKEFFEDLRFENAKLDGSILDGMEFGELSGVDANAVMRGCVCGKELPLLGGAEVKVGTCKKENELEMAIRCAIGELSQQGQDVKRIEKLP